MGKPIRIASNSAAAANAAGHFNTEYYDMPGVNDVSRPIQDIPLDLIRENPLNFYHIHDGEVEALAQAILANDVEAGIAYMDSGTEDKEYTLLSGATRLRALLLLRERGHGKSVFPLHIVDKPSSRGDEMIAISQANQQRSLLAMDRVKLIEVYEEIFQEFHEEEAGIREEIKRLAKERHFDEADRLTATLRIKPNTEKREWIADHCGLVNSHGRKLSGRQISKYLARGEAVASPPAAEEAENAKMRENAAANLSRTMNRRVAVKQKSIVIPYDGSFEDLLKALQTLADSSDLQEIFDTHQTTGTDDCQTEEENV